MLIRAGNRETMLHIINQVARNSPRLPLHCLQSLALFFDRPAYGFNRCKLLSKSSKTQNAAAHVARATHVQTVRVSPLQDLTAIR